MEKWYHSINDVFITVACYTYRALRRLNSLCVSRWKTFSGATRTAFYRRQGTRVTRDYWPLWAGWQMVHHIWRVAHDWGQISVRRYLPFALAQPPPPWAASCFVAATRRIRVFYHDIVNEYLAIIFFTPREIIATTVF